MREIKEVSQRKELSSDQEWVKLTAPYFKYLLNSILFY